MARKISVLKVLQDLVQDADMPGLGVWEKEGTKFRYSIEVIEEIRGINEDDADWEKTGSGAEFEKFEREMDVIERELEDAIIEVFSMEKKTRNRFLNKRGIDKLVTITQKPYYDYYERGTSIILTVDMKKIKELVEKELGSR